MVTASGVAQALDHLLEGKRFDLVICDVVMEGDDGFELPEALQERGKPWIPVVMVTGYRSGDGRSFDLAAPSRPL